MPQWLDDSLTPLSCSVQVRPVFDRDDRIQVTITAQSGPYQAAVCGAIQTRGLDPTTGRPCDAPTATRELQQEAIDQLLVQMLGSGVPCSGAFLDRAGGIDHPAVQLAVIQHPQVTPARLARLAATTRHLAVQMQLAQHPQTPWRILLALAAHVPETRALIARHAGFSREARAYAGGR